MPFYTNLHVDDETALDRRQTKRQVEKYNRRGGIETAFKKIKEVRRADDIEGVRGTEFPLRIRRLLYNAWLMVDFLVQARLDVEFRPKP